MGPDYGRLVPSVLLWTIILITYVSFSLATVHGAIASRDDIPMWTWPGLFIASLGGGAMIVTIVAMLLYPFYYLLSL